MSIKFDLSKRLDAVCRLCKGGSCVADIGCDHGYTSITLIERGVFEKALAMDVRKGPLDIAKQHVMQSGFNEKIECRLSSGFEKLVKGEADTAVITGMGGALIKDILSEYIDVTTSLKQLVLGPQSEIHLVRGFLRDNGFVITGEDMVEEDAKFYQLIRAERGASLSSDKDQTCEDFYGPLLLKNKNEILKKYLEKEHTLYKDLLKRLSDKGITDAIEKRISEVTGLLRINELALNSMEEDI